MSGRKQRLKQPIVEIITSFKRAPKERSVKPDVVMASFELARGRLGLTQATGGALAEPLLCHGHNVDAKDHPQTTPLHYPIRRGRLGVQELLGTHNADGSSSAFSSWENSL